MPNFNIIKKSTINKTFRTKSVIDTFDLQIEEHVKEQFIGNIAIENEEWQIGIIVGSSGSGKSTIARELFAKDYVEKYEYDNQAVIDNMPTTHNVQTITSMFNSVGFATVWSWLKPYHVLSNGERMRVDLARAILSDNETIVFDEFTSVVDRVVAKTASYAISRAIRKTKKKFVAVACHRDIVDWLEPNWIYDTDEQKFFFAETAQNENGQNSRLKFENVVYKYGHYLESIII